MVVTKLDGKEYTNVSKDWILNVLQSEYSSQEQLCDTLADLRFSSNEGSAFTEEGPIQSRPRSRSLTYAFESCCIKMFLFLRTVDNFLIINPSVLDSIEMERIH